MTSSRFLVADSITGGIPEQRTPEHSRWRRPARSRTGTCGPERVPTLIDGMVDLAHINWPESAFVLALPSGEDVFVPWHSPGHPCSVGHAGYFRRHVLPFIVVDPSGRGGTCRLSPLAVGQRPPTVPFFQVDLGSGALVMGSRPPSLGAHP